MLLDLSTILTLVQVVTIDAAHNLCLHFVVCFFLEFVLGDELAVHREPLVVGYFVLVVARVTIV